MLANIHNRSGITQVQKRSSTFRLAKAHGERQPPFLVLSVKDVGLAEGSPVLREVSDQRNKLIIAVGILAEM